MGYGIPILSGALLGQRGFLFPWVPVCLGLGIALYFSLRFEPPVWLLGLGLLGFVPMFIQYRLGAIWGPLIMGLGLMAIGFGWAGMRAHWLAGPVLEYRYYGAIQGRIVAMDRSSSDALRLTLDQVVLERISPGRTPHRVRVSLHGQQGFAPLEPGATVILTGHLARANGPVEPDGFDFRRHAWFLRLGGIGYTRTPVLLLKPPETGLMLFKARMWLSERVQSQLPGDTGGFAAAVMAGDRSGLSRDRLQALRDTNLAHLLAISGLHMGLLAGFVFATARLIMLIVPYTRHKWPGKKLAAVLALFAAAGYLALSGGNVATQRAFVMAAAGLVALLVDRRVLSLRAVAIAAIVVLLLRPEALLSPGFQMSFAATTALVAVFEQISRMQRDYRLPNWAQTVLGVVISSAVAGAATAPIGMAHFNQAAPYGLLANLLSVPVMGILVVPFGVLAGLLMPLGLDWLALAVMGLGLDWIMFVADYIAGWPGAVRPVVSPGAAVLPMLALGALWLAIWQGRARLLGAIPMGIAICLWLTAQRPAVLIAQNGALVGVMTEKGRALSKPKGAGFAARNWLENDGSLIDQGQAAELWPEVENRLVLMPWQDLEIIHAKGKTGARLINTCRSDQIVISDKPLALSGGCQIFDSDKLKTIGAVALWQASQGYDVVTDAALTGQRLWKP
ncbi:MAG: ComEC family competence protein [Pelagimonas sp.]|jgi:competence protein ComEC|nr:ComEC family competence protein [Pelagimonas sp.]